MTGTKMTEVDQNQGSMIQTRATETTGTEIIKLLGITFALR
jgi:hypothetical protein